MTVHKFCTHTVSLLHGLLHALSDFPVDFPQVLHMCGFSFAWLTAHALSDFPVDQTIRRRN